MTLQVPTNPNADFSAILPALVEHFKKSLSPEELAEANRRYLHSMWPSWYTNAETRKRYTPHNDLEQWVVESDVPLRVLTKGGEGSGKSTGGIVKVLNRVRRGMSGVMISPDLEHFKKSLWAEFTRWCPWDMVIERHRYRQEPGRLPNKDFELVFHNEVGGFSTLVCGGAIETDPKRWEGPNVNFALLDEMRRHKTGIIYKTIAGRVRIPGPKGEPPQIFITTTPAKHWLFEFFGPLPCRCEDCGEEFEWDLVPDTKPMCVECGSSAYTSSDPWLKTKLNSAVITLRTEENEPNTYDGFAENRGEMLTEAEQRVLLNAEWEDVEEGQHFLPNIIMWDQCRSDDIPPLSPNDTLILGVDAAKGRDDSYSDCFAIVGVTRHWLPDKRRDHVVVRLLYTWQARPGGRIDFLGTDVNPGPERVIRQLKKNYAVKAVAYDPTELTDMAQRFTREHLVWMDEFSQRSKRIAADTDLLTLILSERIVHDGNKTLRAHIQNADRKTSDDGHQLRMVKRLDSLKIDAAIALSMAASRCLYLNIA